MPNFTEKEISMLSINVVSVGTRNRIVMSMVLGSSVLITAISGQTPGTNFKQAPETGSPTRYLPNRLSQRALAYYGAVWGIDAITVKAVESGELIRFSYQVLDPNKARPLNEKTNNASLIAPAAGLRLSVPSLEKVGQLRQTSTPESGKFYWMAFSNPGRKVKRGDRVNIEIGQFRADGLIVE